MTRDCRSRIWFRSRADLRLDHSNYDTTEQVGDGTVTPAGSATNQSAAIVRGTEWTTADGCDGTLTTVTRGKMAVRDFRRRKTIVVRAGKRYLARARR